MLEQVLLTTGYLPPLQLIGQEAMRQLPRPAHEVLVNLHLTPPANDGELRGLMHQTLRHANHTVHTIVTSSPALWQKVEIPGPHGTMHAIELLTLWTRNQPLNANDLEELRGRLAEQVDCMRVTEYDIDGTRLMEPMSKNTDLSIGGLLGSGLLMMLVVVSHVLLPVGEPRFRDLAGRLVRAQRSFLDAEMRHRKLTLQHHLHHLFPSWWQPATAA